MKKWGELKDAHLVGKEFIDLGNDKSIFVGSSTDIFAANIDQTWIIKIQDHCRKFDNQYLFQTKNIDRIINPAYLDFFPEKTIICTTLETNRNYIHIMNNSPSPESRVTAYEKIDKYTHRKYKKYLTIEPIMDFDLSEFIELIKRCEPEQVNIGADSGGHKLPEPNKDKILMLIDELNKFTNVENKRNIGRLLK